MYPAIPGPMSRPRSGAAAARRVLLILFVAVARCGRRSSRQSWARRLALGAPPGMCDPSGPPDLDVQLRSLERATSVDTTAIDGDGSCGPRDWGSLSPHVLRGRPKLRRACSSLRRAGVPAGESRSNIECLEKHEAAGNCYINNELRTVYIPVLKGGQTHISSILDCYAGPGQPKYNIVPWNGRTEPSNLTWTVVGHCDCANVQRLLPPGHDIAEYFLFTFVRHPVKRFISSFYELLRRGGETAHGRGGHTVGAQFRQIRPPRPPAVRRAQALPYDRPPRGQWHVRSPPGDLRALPHLPDHTL